MKQQYLLDSYANLHSSLCMPLVNRNRLFPAPPEKQKKSQTTHFLQAQSQKTRLKQLPEPHNQERDAATGVSQTKGRKNLPRDKTPQERTRMGPRLEGAHPRWPPASEATRDEKATSSFRWWFARNHQLPSMGPSAELRADSAIRSSAPKTNCLQKTQFGQCTLGLCRRQATRQYSGQAAKRSLWRRMPNPGSRGRTTLPLVTGP